LVTINIYTRQLHLSTAQKKAAQKHLVNLMNIRLQILKATIKQQQAGNFM